MTENERDAGDDMAKLLKRVADTDDEIGKTFGRKPGEWSKACRAAIKAWEDAKNEDA